MLKLLGKLLGKNSLKTSTRTIDPAKSTLIGEGINIESPTKLTPIYLSDKDRMRHTLIAGSTGVGKTRLAELLIEQDIAKGFSVIYFDPKSDQSIFSKIYECAEKYGRKEELQLITPIFPEYSAVVDPMAYHFMVDELIGHITASIPPSNEPFYKDVAQETATAVITGEIMLAKDEVRMPNLNFDHIRQFIRRKNLEEMAGNLRRVSREDLIDESRRIASIIDDILGSSQEHFTKVSMSMRTAMMKLSTGNIGKIIGQAESNKFIKEIEEGRKVITVIHTGSIMARDAGTTLGRVLISTIQGAIGRAYSGFKERMPVPVSIHIDEMQNVLYPGIENLFSMCGSADCMVTGYVQGLAQIRTMLGKDNAEILLDCMNTKIYMRMPNFDSAKYASDHFGTHNVLTGIFGNNQVTTREMEKNVVEPHEILNMVEREFYMSTYSGRWKGKTANCPPPKVKIVFPDAPVSNSAPSIDPEEAA